MKERRTIVVTGANRGIGKEIARGVASRGHRVILACRNLESAEAARAEISAETGNGDLHVMALDLSSRASIEAFAGSFSRDFGKLDVLVNNAGISTSGSRLTEEGLEIHVGTNFVGSYRLTMGMLPLFDPEGPRMILNTTSAIHPIGRFRTADINKHRWFVAYAVSKRMLLLFTKWLSGEKSAEGFSVNAIHPGIVDTSIMYTGRWFDVIIKALCGPFFVDAKEGARTAIGLATADEAPTGMYYVKGKAREIRLSRRARRETRDLVEFCKSL